MVSRPRPYAPERQFDRLMTRVDRVENGAPLVSTSVTNGRTRFVGTESWKLEGSGTVTGILNIDGELIVLGDSSVAGVMTVIGRLSVEGAGVLTVDSLIDLFGDMRVREGGRIVVDDMIIDPSDGGSVRFPSGAKVAAFSGGPGIVVTAGAGPAVIVTDDSVSIQTGDSSYLLDNGVVRTVGDLVIITANDRLNINVPTGDASEAVGYLARRSNGAAFWVDAATGGPTGSGEFMWPFNLATVTREYGPGYEEYEDGVHKGIDFGVPGGSTIPATANGTVQTVGYDAERGNYVILNHGMRGSYELTTRYYHLQAPSPLVEGAAVVKGDPIGGVGTTGLSSGNHLHYETRRNGEHMNPRSFHAVYGE